MSTYKDKRSVKMSKWIYIACSIIIVTVAILAYFILKQREQRVIGIADSSDGKYAIHVVYTDYGGSFAEKGGEHIDAYIMKTDNVLFQKYKIILDTNIPCSVAIGSCTKLVTNDQLDNCIGKKFIAANGQNRCVTNKLESFKISGHSYIWYTSTYSLPSGFTL
ncbi:MAG: hypothetical protein WCO06_06390 [Candidatus Roizmanbacteria bacterium]